MVRHVLGLGGKDGQILWPVVIPYPIVVVNHLFRKKVAPDGYFCHKAMVLNVSLFIGVGMVGPIGLQIAVTVNSPPLPVGITRAEVTGVHTFQAAIVPGRSSLFRS